MDQTRLVQGAVSVELGSVSTHRTRKSVPNNGNGPGGILYTILVNISRSSSDPGVRKFTNILTNCVARFENLKTFGLRSSSKDSRHGSKNGPFTIGQDHVLVFSAIIKAVVADIRRLKTLHTCNGYHNSLAATGLLVSQDTQGLLPLSRELESLHPMNLHKVQTRIPANILSDIIVEAAPSLKVLTPSQCCANRDMSPSYTGISERLNFTRLAELHLCWIETTSYSFQAFPRTAALTLKPLSLASVNLNENNKPPLISDEEAIALGIRWLGVIKDPIN
ncbi:hypothetical protein N7451_009475 [Penicillium sp. IBT 35674x]|nr:hypothetical protein N7451_009475 [Penicillium sp. IBT 35674x]